MFKNKISKIIVGLIIVMLATSCRANDNTSIQSITNEIFEVYKLYQANGGELTYEQWLATIKGEKGEDGQDGLTPYIGSNGNWWIGDSDTGVKAAGIDGSNGKNGSDGKDGNDGKNGSDGKDGVDGKDGKTAFETFLEYYPDYTGTEEDWIKSVSGNGSNVRTDEYTNGLVLSEITGLGYGISNYIGNDELVIVPEYYKGKQVVALLKECFELNNSFNVELPTSIKYIQDERVAGKFV